MSAVSSKIKVLVVDDAALVRQSVSDVLSKDPEIYFMRPAEDPIVAMSRMDQMWPDVIILDIEMPRMDGLTFLKKIMDERPTPVVIMSTLSSKGSLVAIKAMGIGAVATIEKPKIGLSNFIRDGASDLVKVVKEAAMAHAYKMTRSSVPPQTVLHNPKGGEKCIIAIGASMGGTKAIEDVLIRMPKNCPPIVIAQHMPQNFTALFAERLNGMCSISVREAVNGEECLPGVALIAPGGLHLGIKKSLKGGYCATVTDGPLVNRHKPSVDALFRSVSKVAGSNSVGALLTGIGDDGARGLLEIYESGGMTLAESEETCVVFGMPKAAIQMGAVKKIAPLNMMAMEILRGAKI